MKWTAERRAQVLAETIAWCASRGSLDDPATSLRTPELRPDLVTSSQWVESDAVQAAIAQLADKRAQLLRDAGVDVPTIQSASKPELAGGRLLLCDSLDMSVVDGAAEHVSKGFFDIDDLPPWDTWLWYKISASETKPSILLAWVPPIFLALADLGVQHNPVENYVWATPDDIARSFAPEGLCQ